jgi:transposase
VYNLSKYNFGGRAVAKITDMKTRNNIVKLYQEGYSMYAIAKRLMVPESTVHAIVKLWRETGGVERRPQKRGPSLSIPDETLEKIKAILAESPSTPVSKIIEMLQLDVSPSTVNRAIKERLRYSFKKKSLINNRRQDDDVIQAREEHAEKAGKLDCSQVYFLDETGFNTGMARPYGWGPANERLTEFVGDERGCKATLLCAVSLGEPLEPVVFEGALNGNILANYFEHRLLGNLCDNAVIFMDNLAAHKTNAVEDAVAKEGRGIKALYIPAYSPDLNPIEKMWPKLKHIVRGLKPASFDEIIEAIGYSFDFITKKDIEAWYLSCGYSYSIS